MILKELYYFFDHPFQKTDKLFFEPIKIYIFVSITTKLYIMKGRPAIYDNDQVIKDAQQVFWEKGYTATSLSDLVSVTGMGSGSFYNAFKGGKKEVFLKTIRQRRQDFKRFTDELERSDAPIDLIKSFFISLAKADEQSYLKGCIISNTIVEMTFIDEKLQQEAVEILKDVEQLYTNTIRTAQEAGTLSTQTDPQILGRYLITLYNGFHILRRMYPNQEILQEQIDMQLQILH